MKWTEILDRLEDGTGCAAYHEAGKFLAIMTDAGIIVYDYESWTPRHFFVPMDDWTLLI